MTFAKFDKGYMLFKTDERALDLHIIQNGMV